MDVKGLYCKVADFIEFVKKPYYSDRYGFFVYIRLNIL